MASLTLANPAGSAAALCGACDELEHDCCINLLRPSTCPCGCRVVLDPPQTFPSFFVFLNHVPPTPVAEAEPEPVAAGRRPKPAVPEGAYCRQGHVIDAENAYYDPALGRWLCRTCRRASWARSKRRQHQRAREAS